MRYPDPDIFVMSFFCQVTGLDMYIAEVKYSLPISGELDILTIISSAYRSYRDPHLVSIRRLAD